MATPHNDAKKEDIAKTVLMCGDPLRVKFIAENYLENYKLVNSVRNMYLKCVIMFVHCNKTGLSSLQ